MLQVMEPAAQVLVGPTHSEVGDGARSALPEKPGDRDPRAGQGAREVGRDAWLGRSLAGRMPRPSGESLNGGSREVGMLQEMAEREATLGGLGEAIRHLLEILRGPLESSDGEAYAIELGEKLGIGGLRRQAPCRTEEFELGLAEGGSRR